MWSRRGIVLGVMTVCVAAAGLTPVATAADTPGCVSRSELAAAPRGATKARVHAIFDTAGSRQELKKAVEIRRYAACGSPLSLILVTYRKGSDGTFRLLDKDAVWFSGSSDGR